MSEAKKPMYVGLDFARGKDWEPILFTRASAEKYMEKSRQQEAHPEIWSVVVAEFDGYFRGSLGGQAEK